MLTWLRTPSTLNANLAWAFNNPLFSDVNFVFPSETPYRYTHPLSTTTTTTVAGMEEVQWGEESGDVVYPSQRLHAHKVILCARSPYFKALLLGGLRESRDKNIYVDTSTASSPYHSGVSHLNGGVSLMTFHAMVRYLYTNGVEMEETSGEDWLNLLVAANRYSITPLKQLCQDVLEQSVDVENVACLFALADTQQALSLRAACSSFIINHVEVVRRTDSFVSLSEELKFELKKREEMKHKRKRLINK